MNTLNLSSNECIAAIASAPGPAERGILRISGAQTNSVLRRILSEDQPEFHTTQPKRYNCSIPVANGRAVLSVDVHFWPTSKSFTGEPIAEIHCIGSPPLLNEVLEKILTSGARPAERGEFTLRAFLAGRIDLVQAEAVLGVIDAASNDELKTALDQLAGGISGKIGELREDLLLHLADLEAGLDFVEEDIDFVQRPEFMERLRSGEQFLELLLQQSQDRMQSTGLPRIVLAGLPNAGKSTLFNALLQSETAIVSPVAGTTRDYLASEVHERNGLSYQLIDTAGWETARDGIEELAGKQRSDQFERADLIIWCTAFNVSEEEKDENQTLLDACAKLQREMLHITTKSDLEHSVLQNTQEQQPLETYSQNALNDSEQQAPSVNVSVQSGKGIAALQEAISSRLMNSNSNSELTGATSARCRESLVHSHQSIQRAIEMVDVGVGDELVAMELRDALDHLGRIVGVVYTDDILDRIFTRFCIGK